jgi:hypothetical protein
MRFEALLHLAKARVVEGVGEADQGRGLDRKTGGKLLGGCHGNGLGVGQGEGGDLLLLLAEARMAFDDAATIDGAGPVQTFFRITLPMIKPMLGVSLIWVSYISFSTFDIILALPAGGGRRG